MVETAADWAGSLPSVRDQAALNAAINAPQLPHAEVQQAVGTSSHLPQWVANDRKVWKQMVSRRYLLSESMCRHVTLSQKFPWKPPTTQLFGLAKIFYTRHHVYAQVLRWFGYFRERVTDSAGEAEQRLRRIVVHFYLENDTIDICEPRQDNSGLLQVG